MIDGNLHINIFAYPGAFATDKLQGKGLLPLRLSLTSGQSPQTIRTLLELLAYFTSPSYVIYLNPGRKGINHIWISRTFSLNFLPHD